MLDFSACHSSSFLLSYWFSSAAAATTWVLESATTVAAALVSFLRLRLSTCCLVEGGAGCRDRGREVYLDSRKRHNERDSSGRAT